MRTSSGETSGHAPTYSAGSGDSSGKEWKEKLRDGTTVLIRPIRADDVELERRFIERLSAQSRRFRFLGEVKSPGPDLLKQLTQPDPARDVAYIALIADGGEKREVGVSRFSANPDGGTCECAVTVSDEWHNQGLATLLMRRCKVVSNACIPWIQQTIIRCATSPNTWGLRVRRIWST